MKQQILTVFRIIYVLAACLSGVFGILVIASIPLAQTPKLDPWFLIVSLIVSGISFGLAALLAGVARTLSALMHAVEKRSQTPDPEIVQPLFRLTAWLVVAGLFLLLVLTVLNLGVIIRIGEGAAVFG